jgi:hypothetical protein
LPGPDKLFYGLIYKWRWYTICMGDGAYWRQIMEFKHQGTRHFFSTVAVAKAELLATEERALNLEQRALEMRAYMKVLAGEIAKNAN